MILFEHRNGMQIECFDSFYRFMAMGYGNMKITLFVGNTVYITLTLYYLELILKLLIEDKICEMFK